MNLIFQIAKALCSIYFNRSDGSSPRSISFLVFVIIPRYFETHNAISVVDGHRITHSFCSSDRDTNCGLSWPRRPKKHCRFSLNVSQNKIKCFSVSQTPLEQCTHFLSDKGVIGRVYRPRSIWRLWADVLYRLNQARWFLFLMFVT